MIFYHTILISIPIPTHSTELISKREGNCNVMTCRSRVARNPVTPQSHLSCYRYELFFAPHYCYYKLISSTAYYCSYGSIFSSLYHACQHRHFHTHGISPPNRLETRIVMILADQTNKTYQSNIGRNLGGVQSMSIITTQLFANCKRAVEYQLIYLVFCIISKPSSTRR